MSNPSPTLLLSFLLLLLLLLIPLIITEILLPAPKTRDGCWPSCFLIAKNCERLLLAL